MSENRHQKSDTVQVGFSQSSDYAENLMFSVVEAGLKRPPANRSQISEVRSQKTEGRCGTGGFYAKLRLS